MDEVGTLPLVMNGQGVVMRTIELLDQGVVPDTLRSRTLHMSHFSKISGQPWGHK